LGPAQQLLPLCAYISIDHVSSSTFCTQQGSALNFIKTSIMVGDKQPEQRSTLLDSLEQERLRCIRRNQAMLEQCQAGAALPIGPDNPSA
jgi:hypothetical protein